MLCCSCAKKHTDNFAGAAKEDRRRGFKPSHLTLRGLCWDTKPSLSEGKTQVWLKNNKGSTFHNWDVASSILFVLLAKGAANLCSVPANIGLPGRQDSPFLHHCPRTASLGSLKKIHTGVFPLLCQFRH